MSELAVSGRTQQVINLSAGEAAVRLNRTARESSPEEPLKKFHEYFGKVQPSLYQELRNIFQNSGFEDRAVSPSPDCHVQGLALGPRVRLLRPHRRDLSPIRNHFTIESLNSRSLTRKARLNRLLLCQQALQDDDLPEAQTQSLLQEGGKLVSELQTALKRAVPRYGSTQGAQGRSFRVSREARGGARGEERRFSGADLNQAVCLLHQVEVQVSPSVGYFNVFVEEGNNAELVKALVRKRSGWRVVELPEVANLIWTQFYRKNLLRRRLHKRQKSDSEDDPHRLTLRPDHRLRPSPRDHSHSPDPDNYGAELRKLIAPCEEEGWLTRRGVARAVQVTHNVLVHNHFPNNSCISDKKNLLQQLTRHFQAQGRDVFSIVPETLELTDLAHPFLAHTSTQDAQHWIIKPGENSNRGRGIAVAHSSGEAAEEVRRRLSESEGQGRRRSVMVQRYVVPVLYCGRKFDIRSYMLVTYLNRQVRMYTYEECYIRTSSRPFDIASASRLVHLTNDAVQAHAPDYGKFEEGNKLAEHTFARYIDEEYRRTHPDTNGVWQSIKAEMQRRCVEVMQASCESLVRGVRREREGEAGKEERFFFELFGMDFMVDLEFKVWLIEVNTNPAITHDCSRVLNRLIPRLLDNVLAIAVEPLMRPFRLQDHPLNHFTAAFKRTL